MHTDIRMMPFSLAVYDTFLACAALFPTNILVGLYYVFCVE